VRETCSTVRLQCRKQIVRQADTVSRKEEERMASPKAPAPREFSADVVIIGGGTGGTAAALAAASLGVKVIITEQTDCLGGQLTAQAVPPDENEWIEHFGCTRRYRTFRDSVRAFYRNHYPLLPSARNNPHLNPGGGYVSHLCYEPRIGHIVLQQMLMWPRARGFIRVLPCRVPVSADVSGDNVKAVTVRNVISGEHSTLTAPYFLDATEFGDVLPMAGVEYVVGSESQAETGEPHAPEGPSQPDNVEAITWCFPMAWDTAPHANHTIAKPPQYNRWRRYMPDTHPPWGSNLLSWGVCRSQERRDARLRPLHHWQAPQSMAARPLGVPSDRRRSVLCRSGRAR